MSPDMLGRTKKATAMHEPILDLKRVPWSPMKEVVRVFYKEMWDNADTSLVPHLFHPNFTFRGSLGPQLSGHEQFIEYVRFVTRALGQYTTDILALAEEGNQVIAKVRFHGLHQRELLGVQPTGRHVWWHGMPVFTFDGPLVSDLWVLGDLYNLEARLRGKEK
jgi:predicted ester cyclase